MPTFGADTIRRFTNNVSEMKQMAARDFEDLLHVRETKVFFLALVPTMFNFGAVRSACL